MNTLRQIFAGPTSRRPRRIIGPVFWLITWSFFGTVRQVMHLGAFLTALFWLGGIYGTMCVLRWARANVVRIPAREESVQVPKNDMEKAA